MEMSDKNNHTVRFR